MCSFCMFARSDVTSFAGVGELERLRAAARRGVDPERERRLRARAQAAQVHACRRAAPAGQCQSQQVIVTADRSASRASRSVSVLTGQAQSTLGQCQC